MALPYFETLQSDKWANLTAEERLFTLNEFEKIVAHQEGRSACEVVFLPESDRRTSTNGEPLRRGQYDAVTKEIQIEPLLLSDQESRYQALETYFHEARHAYQHHAIQILGFHADEAQVTDWEINHSSGYISANDVEKGFEKRSNYRWQPVEADANKIARSRTNELYEGMFQQQQYQSYKAEKEQEESKAMGEALYEQSSWNYEKIARDRVREKSQGVEHDPSIHQESLSARGEDYDYDYGYSL